MENEVRKQDSPCWDSKICLENSEWISENIKGLDRSVKEMLLLIERNGNYLVEKPLDDYPMQPELIACIKDISERHHLLAIHCNKLTEELNNHIQSANEIKSHEKNALMHDLTLPFQTPDKNLGMQNVEGYVFRSELSFSSGGGISDTTPIEGSESSLLSSDSDSESYNSSPSERSNLHASEKMPKQEIVNLETKISEMGSVIALTEQKHSSETIKAGESVECEALIRQILGYKKESKVYKEKLQFAEEEIGRLKSELLNNEALTVKMSRIEAQLVSAENQIKLHEAEIGKENKRSLMFQRQIVDLEAQLESEKRQVQELRDIIKKYTEELLDRDLNIQKLNAEFQDASGSFALEKWQLESSVSMLSERLTFQEARTNELQKQCESFEAEKVEMIRKQDALKTSWQDNIEHVEVELCEKTFQMDTLNKNLDELKLNYDMLMAEKDGANAKLQRLSADLSVGEDRIQCLECNLHELHSENERLSTGSDNANKLIADLKSRIQCLERNLHELHSENERLSTGSDNSNKLIADLKSRIDELEKEVEMQAVMISDTAEGKREAVRQLCFSLDHFRSAYQELRKEYAIRKRPTTVVL